MPRLTGGPPGAPVHVATAPVAGDWVTALASLLRRPHPKKTTRRSPPSLAAGCLLLAVLTGTACEPSSETLQARGRVLNLSITPVQRVAEIGYSGPDGSYVIRPRSTDHVFLLSKVTVSNTHAALASLLIDEQAVSLEDTRGNRHRAVSPWLQRQNLDQPVAKDNAFTPFLWGASNLMDGYSVNGWLVFEVPTGETVRTLIWNQVETIRIFFPDQAG